MNEAADANHGSIFSIKMIPRSKWTSSKPDYPRLETIDRPYDEIVCHHTGTRNTARSVYQLHVVERKWGDVGYHFMIDRDGLIYEGRSLRYLGAHVESRNHGKVGVAFLGDYTIQPNPAAQIASARYLVGTLRRGIGTIRRLSHHGMYDPRRTPEAVMPANYHLQRLAIESGMSWGPGLK